MHVTRQVLVPSGVTASPLSAATPTSELVAALNAQQPEVLVGAVGIWRALAEEPVLSSALALIAEVGESACVHDARGLHAQVVISPGAATDVPQRLRHAVIAAVTSTDARTPAVDVRPVSTLAREPGGKLRLVRSV